METVEQSSPVSDAISMEPSKGSNPPAMETVEQSSPASEAN
jgi:hypothetical protein